MIEQQREEGGVNKLRFFCVEKRRDGNGKFLSQSQRERAVIPYPPWGMNKHISRGPGKGIEIRNQEEPQDQQKNVALQEITEK